jgi:stearoyl-CoA desaturase (delta-9 desaturase)
LGKIERGDIRDVFMQLWKATVVIIFLWLLFAGQLTWVDAIIVIAVHYVLYTLGLELGYHKLLSHRAFKTKTWIRNILVFIGTCLAHPSVLAWVDIHRIHHSNSDKQGDPHSPWFPQRGFWKYLFLTSLPRTKNTYEFSKDKTLMWFEEHQPHIIWAVSIILYSVIGLKATLVWFLLPSLISPYCLGIANYITHQGKHNGYDYARNWYWIEILAPGMGFHGNHHDTPGSWTLAKKYWWADVSSIIVKLIKR